MRSTRPASPEAAFRLIRTAAAVLILVLILPTRPALALSEFQEEELPQAEADDGIERRELPEPEAELTPSTGQTVPLPDPPGSTRRQAPADEEAPADEPPEEGEETTEPTAPQTPVPEVHYDLSLLPEPVRRMHGLLVEACRSGDIERLRPLIETGQNATQLSFGAIGSDPIEFLREMSGDSEGHEILAIMLEVLSAGYVNLDPGQPQELYVWPYFFAVPLENLDAGQRVELFKIVTAGDYEDMKTYGAYIFYRLGITPEGRWAFFVAGD
ncbi:MAG: hypothetical protein K5872_17740 [Rhizobiaceae bacterium]|nr:hypothetical protein [Rhizobiaceae bacterium]MCV0408067.1 hypothetical protein [Rhizobiaceae bacterium]